MTTTLRRCGALTLIALSALTAGCAVGYRLDNQVQSFSALQGVPTPASYRFERLPSQAADPGQAQLEAWADAALLQAGFRRDDAAPRYSVQVSAKVERRMSPYADPYDSWGWGRGLGVGIGLGGSRGGVGFSYGLPRNDHPWFYREVNVIVREVAGNRVVYETRAINDGPWLDNSSVLPAMFQAALQGFPNPPQGPRRVDIQVGGAKTG
jgi:hypothetical protein